MVLKDKGSIIIPKPSSRGGARVYISSKIMNDSQFPFSESGEILVEIDVEKGIVKLIPITE